MRGAEDAGRYAVNAVRRGARLHADRTRVLASDIPEDPPKGPKAPPAGTQGDFGDGQAGLAQ